MHRESYYNFLRANKPLANNLCFVRISMYMLDGIGWERERIRCAQNAQIESNHKWINRILQKQGWANATLYLRFFFLYVFEMVNTHWCCAHVRVSIALIGYWKPCILFKIHTDWFELEQSEKFCCACAIR